MARPYRGHDTQGRDREVPCEVRFISEEVTKIHCILRRNYHCVEKNEMHVKKKLFMAAILRSAIMGLSCQAY